jgi:hypothetical protein
MLAWFLLGDGIRDALDTGSDVMKQTSLAQRRDRLSLRLRAREEVPAATG